MRRRSAAAVLAAALVLSGCAGQDPYPATVADRLQDTVLQVTASAASGDLDAALTALAELEARVEAAHAAGQLPDSRYDEVKDAIARTRAKLEEQRLAAGATPAPAPSDGDESDAGAGRNQDEEPDDEAPAPDEAAPPATAAPSASPTPTPEPSDAPSAPLPSGLPTASPDPLPTPTGPPAAGSAGEPTAEVAGESSGG